MQPYGVQGSPGPRSPALRTAGASCTLMYEVLHPPDAAHVPTCSFYGSHRKHHY